MQKENTKMSQLIELTDNISAVEVPEGAINFTIDMGYLIYKVPNYKNWVNDSILADYGKLTKHLETHSADNDYKMAGKPLPGNWQIICTTKECTEEQARVITQASVINTPGAYRNHEWPKGPTVFNNPVDSLRSLITSKGLDPEKNYVLIKKQ